MTPLLCGCRSFDKPCAKPATQEDLLCNTCRGGCTAVLTPLDGPQAGKPIHLGRATLAIRGD